MPLLLAGLLLVALFLVPLGLPGTWLMICVAVGYNMLVPGDPIGWVAIVGTTMLALVAEVIEFMLAGRFARRYGGSKRAGWGAIVGGIAGAFIGLPVPVLGPMLGAFAGAFAGALLAEYTVGVSAGAATRVAWGALLGRVAAVAVKVGVGCAMIAWLVIAALA